VGDSNWNWISGYIYQFKERSKKKGIRWIFPFIIRQLPGRILDELFIMKHKQQLLKDDPDCTIDMPSHSVESNRKIWNTWEWSDMGSEWTDAVQKFRDIEPEKWKTNLINQIMLKYIEKNSVILEIGPGGGRWTEILQPIAKKLILADISQKCLDICKSRFALSENIDYKFIEKRLYFLKDNSIDFVWSYDVFVHINPSDIKNYLQDLKRILKPGGCAIIHHAGLFTQYAGKRETWRAYLGKNQFAKLVADQKLTILEQNEELTHVPGDIISIISKPKN